MARVIARDVRVYFGGYDPSKSTTEVIVALEAEALDPTAFTDSGERALAGLRRDAFTWAGWFDDAATAPTADLDAAAAARIGSGTNNVITVHLGTGSNAIGYAGTAVLTTHKPVGRVGELVRLEAALKVDGSLGRGRSYGERAALTLADGTGVTGSVDNAAQTTAGGTWYVHVFSYSGTGTAVVHLEDSADGTAFSSVGTVGAVGSGTLSRRVAVAGTIRRYTRMLGTGTGTNVQVAAVLVRD